MELKWIEDFLSLVDTGSFSRAAERRHVTQPAFSRRIRALENWTGTYLIDRSSSPVNLTAAGKVFRIEALKILTRVNTLRSRMHGRSAPYSDLVMLTLPYTCSPAMFSKWLSKVEQLLGGLGCGLAITTVPDLTLAQSDSNCDLVMCYHHSDCLLRIDSEHYDIITLGHEKIKPFVRAVRGRRPLFEFPGRCDAPVPFLAYSYNSYMHSVTATILNQAPTFLIERDQADTIEHLKSKVIDGCGIAFLPESAIRDESERRHLTVAGDDRWQLELEIRLYLRHNSINPGIDRLWSCFDRMHTAPALL